MEAVPCGERLCNQCDRVLNGDHPDMMELDASESKAQLERVRDLRASVLTRPLLSERRVFAINHAEQLSEPSQNALLKILEEPPPYARFLLFTARSEALLPTVRSRCILVRQTEADSEPEDTRGERDKQAALFIKAAGSGQELEICRVVMGWTRMSRGEFALLLESLYEGLARAMANGTLHAEPADHLANIVRELLEEQIRNVSVSAACAKLLAESSV